MDLSISITVGDQVTHNNLGPVSFSRHKRLSLSLPVERDEFIEAVEVSTINSIPSLIGRLVDQIEADKAKQIQTWEKAGVSQLELPFTKTEDEAEEEAPGAGDASDVSRLPTESPAQ